MGTLRRKAIQTFPRPAAVHAKGNPAKGTVDETRTRHSLFDALHRRNSQRESGAGRMGQGQYGLSGGWSGDLSLSDVEAETDSSDTDSKCVRGGNLAIIASEFLYRKNCLEL